MGSGERTGPVARDEGEWLGLRVEVNWFGLGKKKKVAMGRFGYWVMGSFSISFFSFENSHKLV